MDLSEPFLKVKLLRPQIRPDRVSRGRLLQQLDRVFLVPLTLVCAPAGYGKTTLLVEWATNCSQPVVWLSLSSEENDLARFLNYFILALQQVEPEMGKSTQAAMNVPGASAIESCLHLLVNELASLSIPMAIVLDDYHEIESQELHSMVAHLIDHLPPMLHLVLATRVEPLLPLARQRGRGTILEIRTKDLCFQPDEINEFFNQVMSLDLREETIKRLEKNTEGWIAAMQLAALSFQSGENSFTAAITQPGQHYIFEYLAEEIFRKQSKPLQEFLLYTSILEQLSGPLCDAIATPFPPYQSSAECLEALEHGNLFTQALDDDHSWYRYHRLFSDFLTNQLKFSSPNLIPTLHQKAAAWLSTHGVIDQAFRHAILGGNLNQAIQLVENHAQELEKRGELGTLEQWLNRLTDDVIRTRPRLCLARAWISFGRLDTQKVEENLDLADELCKNKDDPSLRGEIMAARAFLAGMMDQPDKIITYTEEALNLLSTEQQYLSSLLKINRCFPLMMAGYLPEAAAMLEEAVQHARATNNYFIALLGIRILGEAYILLGKLTQAERIFQQALDLIQTHYGKHSPLLGVARMGLGEVFRQRNQMDQAAIELDEGISMVIDWMPAIVMDGLIWLSNLKQATGDPTGALNQLLIGKEISLINSNLLLDEWMLPISFVRLNILQGNLEDAQQWVQKSGLDMENLTNLDQFQINIPLYFRLVSLTTLARFYLVLGTREKTLGALEKAQIILEHDLSISQSHGEYSNYLEGLILMAQVASARGNSIEAQDYLHRALDLGEPERPIRVFLDEGDPLMNILAERRSMKLPRSEQDYLDTLWSAWQAETRPKDKIKPVMQDGLVEPISFRELEVLRCIASGKSNQEIASELVLSLNTVKKHVSTIMSKLNAKNRAQAVLIARQLGIMES